MFLRILHMSNLKKLALIATEIWGKNGLRRWRRWIRRRTPKQYLPPLFKNGREVKIDAVCVMIVRLDKISKHTYVKYDSQMTTSQKL